MYSMKIKPLGSVSSNLKKFSLRYFLMLFCPLKLAKTSINLDIKVSFISLRTEPPNALNTLVRGFITLSNKSITFLEYFLRATCLSVDSIFSIFFISTSWKSLPVTSALSSLWLFLAVVTQGFTVLLFFMNLITSNSSLNVILIIDGKLIQIYE